MTHITEHKRIHLIGIGGCSMSGLASILKNRGYYVQGSDRAESPFTERLKELGVPVFIGHDAKNIGDCDLIIFSAAIKSDNVERAEAKRRGADALWLLVATDNPTAFSIYERIGYRLCGQANIYDADFYCCAKDI